MAEDEENCFAEYKWKGLVAKSANLICQSPFHNIDSPSIKTLAFNFTAWNIDLSMDYYNFTAIPSGIIVQILATHCNGILECWKGKDEENCGSNMFKNVSIGKHFPFKHGIVINPKTKSMISLNFLNLMNEFTQY